MIKLIILDYDGVIVDSFQDVHKSYMKTCEKLGVNCPTELKEFKKIYGNSSTECYHKLGFSDEEIIEVNKVYRKESFGRNSIIFEGIEEVLKKLKKEYILIALSSYYRDELQKKLTKLNLTKYFQEIIGRESSVIKRFEKTKTIKEILQRYNLDVSEVLSIGDRTLDFIEGTNAGLKNILLVDYGWGYDPNQIPEYKKKITINKPIEILNAIKLFS